MGVLHSHKFDFVVKGKVSEWLCRTNADPFVGQRWRSVQTSKCLEDWTSRDIFDGDNGGEIARSCAVEVSKISRG